LCTIFSETGYFSNKELGRIGLLVKLPPQFGQTLCRISSTHDSQKVHSKVQIIASLESKGNDLLQFSQLGRISNIL
jgi:hypothetical protein